MSVASPSMSSMFFAIKGVDSFHSIKLLFDTSSGKFVRAIEVEPRQKEYAWAKRVEL